MKKKMTTAHALAALKVKTSVIAGNRSEEHQK
jgi:hypothetical protein